MVVSRESPTIARFFRSGRAEPGDMLQPVLGTWTVCLILTRSRLGESTSPSSSLGLSTQRLLGPMLTVPPSRLLKTREIL